MCISGGAVSTAGAAVTVIAATALEAAAVTVIIAATALEVAAVHGQVGSSSMSTSTSSITSQGYKIKREDQRKIDGALDTRVL